MNKQNNQYNILKEKDKRIILERNERNLKIVQEYYSDLDVSIFEKKLKHISSRLHSLKRESSKKGYYIDIYTLYLQIVEVFCINSFVFVELNIANLFIDSRDLREKIFSSFISENNRDAEGKLFFDFLVETIHGVGRDMEYQNNIVQQDIAQQKIDYKKIIKESVKDYLKNKDALNSYKHGFRIYETGPVNMSVKLDNSNMPPIVLVDNTASFAYYSKNHISKSEYKIILNRVSFNWERLECNIGFLLNSIENLKKVTCARGVKSLILLKHLYFEDRHKYDKHFGGTKFTEVKWIVKKSKN